MTKTHLVLSMPQGIVTATSLGLGDFAWHRSPGSGKYFQGRSILIELAVEHGKPAFTYLDEGGWRDAAADTAVAMEGAQGGKKTKTALSNNAFSCTPIAAYRSVHLVKTGGQLLGLEGGGPIAEFRGATCTEQMTPNEIAEAIGQPTLSNRTPRLYMTFGPIEFLVLSTLTPAEYTWYATHRPGKKFRQVMFAELREPQPHLTAQSIFDAARRELAETAGKKTKTILIGETLNRVPFSAWSGYDRETEGGLYVGDGGSMRLWRLPERIPRAWERAY